jgi:hypothetical protein
MPCMPIPGDQGSVLLVSNPGVAASIFGLAGGAAYQSAVDRHLLWQRRNETVEPYGVTVQQFVEGISALRDQYDGPLVRFALMGMHNVSADAMHVCLEGFGASLASCRGWGGFC